MGLQITPAAQPGANTDITSLQSGVGLTAPKVTTAIQDANNNSMLAFTATASAVDGFTFTNAATANPATVTMAATGSDSNINIALTPKGTGSVNVGSATLVTPSIQLASGSTSTPSLRFGTDSTGWYRNASGQWSWYSGSQNNLSLISSVIRIAKDLQIGWSTSGDSTSAVGVGLINDGSNAGLQVMNGTAGQWAYLKSGVRDSGTTTVTNGLTIGHQSTGTPAAGLGSGILFNIDSSTTADQNAAQILSLWTTATHASRTADIVFKTVNNAAALSEVLRITAAGVLTFADGSNESYGTSTGTKLGTSTSQKLGFWNVTPVVQQVLATGAAHTVDDVITLLQTIGLCKQS